LVNDGDPNCAVPVRWCQCDDMPFLEVLGRCDICRGWIAPLRWGMVMPNFDRTVPERPMMSMHLSPHKSKKSKRPTRPKRTEEAHELLQNERIQASAVTAELQNVLDEVDKLLEPSRP